MIVNQYVPFSAGPVTVASDFLGHSFFGFPELVGGDYVTPAPDNLPYKLTVNIDWQQWGGSKTGWQYIETSPGVYDWSIMDVWVAGNAARGTALCYSCFLCPAFYSANPLVVNTVAKAGPGMGGPLSPDGRTGFYNFVYALISRYKSMGTPLKYFQAWSEPWWPVNTDKGYWWGTREELVDLAHIAYTACKAADPDIVVVGVADSINLDWAASPGSFYPGVYGWQTHDLAGLDSFDHWPTNFPRGQGEPSTVKDNTRDIRWLLKTISKNTGPNAKPIFVTSMALNTDGRGTIGNYLRGQTPEYRKTLFGRALMQFAGMGASNVVPYAYDGDLHEGKFNIGDFINDTDGVIAAYKEFSQAFVGKTITFSGVRSDGHMRAFFSDGSSYRL